MVMEPTTAVRVHDAWGQADVARAANISPHILDRSENHAQRRGHDRLGKSAVARVVARVDLMRGK